jgi:hypothetical protein
LSTNTLSPLLKRMEKIPTHSFYWRWKKCYCAANRKRRRLKEQAKPIPEKLIKILLTENIDVSDVIKLKEMLNDWITLLTDNNKKQKNKNKKTNNMELLDKLNWIRC